MKNVNIFICLLILFIIACKNNDNQKAEKFQKRRNEIINFEDKIIDIKTEILFGNSLLYIINDVLIVNEISPSGDKGIHLFNKNTFEYITSTGIIGKGPGEVARQGRIGVDAKNKIFWVSDHGKKVMWKFHLDSVLKNEMYKPTENVVLFDDLFLSRFDFLNDSIALGKAVRILSTSTFDMISANLNLNTNKIKVFGYQHPKAVDRKSNSQFKLSVENNFYVNCYAYCDLMTICDVDGKLKYNIYGRQWLNKDNKKTYFKGVDLFKNYIISSYIGDAGVVYNEFKRPVGNLPSKFLVFDLEGNYIQTTDTGYKFTYFCVDEENKRIIVYFDGKENPLAYINLNLN